MDIIGNRIKNAIKNSKYTQKEIGEIINISQTSLSAYTQGKASITVEILKKICDAIEVPIQEIVYGIDMTNDEELLLSNYRQLNDEQKKMIIKNTEFLAKENKEISLTSMNTKIIDFNEYKRRKRGEK